jgi:hypothetical protein
MWFSGAQTGALAPPSALAEILLYFMFQTIWKSLEGYYLCVEKLIILAKRGIPPPLPAVDSFPKYDIINGKIYLLRITLYLPFVVMFKPNTPLEDFL